MQTRRIRHSSRSNRAGLAPLEFVLSLPVMLFVMGLMIIFGMAGRMKIRTVVNAREAVWRNLAGNPGGNSAIPGWPANGHTAHEPQDQRFLYDRFGGHQVVRGPVVLEPDGRMLQVRRQHFDITKGLEHGVAQVKVPYPVLGAVPPGEVDLIRHHPLINGRWELVGHGQRRILAIYDVQLSHLLHDLEDEFSQAAFELLHNPNNPILEILDNDDELKRGAPWGLGSAPNYYLPSDSQLRQDLTNPDRLCTDDPAGIRERLETMLVGRLIQSIQGIYGERDQSPAHTGISGRMTADFLRMYRQQLSYINGRIDRLKSELENLDPKDPNTPQRKREIPPEIAEWEKLKPPIEQKVRQLEAFEKRLLEIELEPPESAMP
jgi:hypothetical protein